MAVAVDRVARRLCSSIAATMGFVHVCASRTGFHRHRSSNSAREGFEKGSSLQPHIPTSRPLLFDAISCLLALSQYLHDDSRAEHASKAVHASNTLLFIHHFSGPHDAGGRKRRLDPV